MGIGRGIGSHQSAKMKNDEWLTPPSLLGALQPFDLDPCSPIIPPWHIADTWYHKEMDGLMLPWHGFVWLNPPYGKYIDRWMERMAMHNNGIALTFARTETEVFFKYVWDRASSVFFIKGRLYFHYVTGERADANGGAPSVLVGYGEKADARLSTLSSVSDIRGQYIKLNN